MRDRHNLGRSVDGQHVIVIAILVLFVCPLDLASRDLIDLTKLDHLVESVHLLVEYQTLDFSTLGINHLDRSNFALDIPVCICFDRRFVCDPCF